MTRITYGVMVSRLGATDYNFKPSKTRDNVHLTSTYTTRRRPRPHHAGRILADDHVDN